MTKTVPWRLLLALLVLCAGFSTASGIARAFASDSVTAGSVAMYRGGPARTGENPGPGPTGSPVVLWKSWLGQVISSTPAVVAGIAYVGSISPVTLAGGALHAVDVATGEEVWRRPTDDGDAFISSPAVADGLVYIGSYFGIIIAADAATGEERWRFQADGPIYSSPAVVDGVVYFGDDIGNLYALDATTGGQRWRLALDNPYERSFNPAPAVVDGILYVVAGSRRAGQTSELLALDAATGTERWRFAAQEGGSLRGATAVAGGTAYVVTTDGFLYAVDIADGHELWHVDGGAPTILANPAVVDGVAYFANAEGELHALDATSGRQRWTRRLTGAGALTSSPTVAGDSVYVGNADGILFAVDVATGVERWHLSVGSYYSSPAIVGGVIYVGSDRGLLVALGDPQQDRP